MRFLLILWLASLSAGVAAVIGGRAAWRLRLNSGRRTEFGIAWAIMLWAFALAKFGMTYNAIANRPGGYTIEYVAWQIAWGTVEALGVWVIALTMMNGNQGFIRRWLARTLEKMEGKAEREKT